MKFSKWHIAPAEEADIRRLGEAGLGETKLQASFPHGLAEVAGKPDDV